MDHRVIENQGNFPNYPFHDIFSGVQTEYSSILGFQTLHFGKTQMLEDVLRLHSGGVPSESRLYAIAWHSAYISIPELVRSFDRAQNAETLAPIDLYLFAHALNCLDDARSARDFIADHAETFGEVAALIFPPQPKYLDDQTHRLVRLVAERDALIAEHGNDAWPDLVRLSEELQQFSYFEAGVALLEATRRHSGSFEDALALGERARTAFQNCNAEFFVRKAEQYIGAIGRRIRQRNERQMGSGLEKHLRNIREATTENDLFTALTEALVARGFAGATTVEIYRKGTPRTLCHRHDGPNLTVKTDRGVRVDFAEFIVSKAETALSRLAHVKDAKPIHLGNIVFHDEGYQPMFRAMQHIATGPQREVVVLMGEPGVGKTAIAEEIHRLRYRCDAKPNATKPFVIVDASLWSGGDINMVRSELFGHVKGAYTGAGTRRGAIELAKNGTLFIDEFADISPDAQKLLLRAFESRTYAVLGDESNQERPVECKIVVAINRTMDELAQEGILRKDIISRLGSQIRIPSLRDVPNQIMPLSKFLIRKHLQRNHQIAAEEISFNRKAESALLQADFPHNTRGLNQLCEWLAGVIARDQPTEITADLIENFIENNPEKIRSTEPAPNPPTATPDAPEAENGPVTIVGRPALRKRVQVPSQELSAAVRAFVAKLPSGTQYRYFTATDRTVIHRLLTVPNYIPRPSTWRNLQETLMERLRPELRDNLQPEIEALNAAYVGLVPHWEIL
jgi:DNA-binding NtrC family response regulator